MDAEAPASVNSIYREGFLEVELLPGQEDASFGPHGQKNLKSGVEAVKGSGTFFRGFGKRSSCLLLFFPFSGTEVCSLDLI